VPQTPTEHASAQQVYSHVRARVAFEQMVLSVLHGALLSAALVFAVRILAGLFGLNFGFVSFLTIITITLTYAFVVFLTGFLSAVIVGVPLFQLLEARKFRQAWPYFAAAIFVELVFWLLVRGGFPDFVSLPIATSVSLVAPGVIIAALFARRMGPVWRQAENAERSRSAAIVRFH